MFRKSRQINLLLSGLLSLIAVIVLAVGCGESPTASGTDNTSGLEMWNPSPGTEVEPGREVPLVNEGYWEELNGPSVNPRRYVTNSIENIGEAGGTVTLGYHNYFIPPGAVHESNLFTLAYASLSGIGVDCGPSPFTFREPVLLTLSYRGTQYDQAGADPSQLRIYYVTEDGVYEGLDTSVDLDGRCLRTYVDHFSRYIVG